MPFLPRALQKNNKNLTLRRATTPPFAGQQDESFSSRPLESASGGVHVRTNSGFSFQQAEPLGGAATNGSNTLPTQSVVKIFGVGAARSYLEPWKVGAQKEWTGSGFAVEIGGEKLVLTNAHVCDHAFLLRLSRHGESKKHPAKLVCIAHDVDLALLAVEAGPSVLENVPATRFEEDLPKLYSEVKVVGFPQGGSTICVTKGVVSRVDAQGFVHPLLKGVLTDNVLIIQIDAAINPGNSGGPAFAPDTGQVIGVASSGMPGAQNIGYIIPAMIVRNLLLSYEQNRSWPGLPELGFNYRTLENESLRQYLGMGTDKTGVEVTDVAPKGTLAGKIEPGDVILKIDGHDVSSEGTVSYDVHKEKVNLSFEFLVTKDLPGITKKLTVLRKGKAQELASGFMPVAPLAARFDGVDCQPTYFMIGGFIFAPLSLPLIHHDADVPGHLVEKAYTCWKEGDEQMVVFQRGLQHQVNEGYELDAAKLLLTVQGEPVKNMEGLIRGVAKAILAKADFLVFGFENAKRNGEQKEVLRVDGLEQADAELMEQHQIPACVSSDLQELYFSVMPESERGRGVLSTLMRAVCCPRSGKVDNV